MEEHPIPQNVTGFQFRLIGTMTVKQFAYVAAGAVAAVLIYYMPVVYIIKVVLIPFFALFGLALAFVPIEGRPMDAMTMYYFRALFAPNQYIYKKKGGRIAIASLTLHKNAHLPFGEGGKHQASQAKEKNLQTLLRSVREGKSQDDKLANKSRPIIISLEEEKPFQPLSFERAAEVVRKDHPKEATQDQKKKKDLLDQQIDTLKKALIEARTGVPYQTLSTPLSRAARKKIHEIEQQLQEVEQQKKQLEDEIIKLQQRLTKQKQPAERAIQKSTVRKIPLAIAQSVGLPKVSSPNLIAGIVKDARGNVLPNILIEIKDKDGNPVRAFKTNGLGQFVSATRLLNGTYHIELEDPRTQHKFDIIEIVANGTMLDPLEIISVDQREELRQSLFET